MNDKFDKAGAAPKTYIRDNEAFSYLKATMNKTLTTHQLVPPHNHPANPIKQAIQTFKNNLIAIYSNTC